MFQGAELECIIPIASAWVIRLRWDQVTAGEQLVALDGGVVVDGPLVLFEGLGEVEGQPVVRSKRSAARIIKQLFCPDSLSIKLEHAAVI